MPLPLPFNFCSLIEVELLLLSFWFRRFLRPNHMISLNVSYSVRWMRCDADDFHKFYFIFFWTFLFFVQIFVALSCKWNFSIDRKLGSNHCIFFSFYLIGEQHNQIVNIYNFLPFQLIMLPGTTSSRWSFKHWWIVDTMIRIQISSRILLQ